MNARVFGHLYIMANSHNYFKSRDSLDSDIWMSGSLKSASLNCWDITSFWSLRYRRIPALANTQALFVSVFLLPQLGPVTGGPPLCLWEAGTLTALLEGELREGKRRTEEFYLTWWPSAGLVLSESGWCSKQLRGIVSPAGTFQPSSLTWVLTLFPTSASGFLHRIPLQMISLLWVPH